jgi:hypothetical protein
MIGNKAVRNDENRDDYGKRNPPEPLPDFRPNDRHFMANGPGSGSACRLGPKGEISVQNKTAKYLHQAGLRRSMFEHSLETALIRQPAGTQPQFAGSISAQCRPHHAAARSKR